MSLPDNTDKSQLEAIHFDTLLNNSLVDVEHYSGKIWTDKGEHDPGITLLEALTWTTADLAYRHTFPVTDLLQPLQKDGKIFPVEFGPKKVLTCAPITMDDYRRAILDLSTDATPAQFFFRDVQLLPITDKNQQYQYAYKAEIGQFVFTEAAETNFHVTGDYQIFYELNRGIDKASALNALQTFLAGNRHLCENFQIDDTLGAQEISLKVSVELNDDWVDYQQTLNDIILLIENIVSPSVPRNKEGNSQDPTELIQGPDLKNGWITALAPVRDYLTGFTLDIRKLAQSLKQITGIKSVLVLGFTADKDWQVAIEAKKYPVAWKEAHNNPQDIASLKKILKDNIKLSKQGQEVELDALYENAITQLFSHHLAVPQALYPMPTGSYRDTKAYYPTTGFLPTPYGFKTPGLDENARHLALFLSPFESWNFLQQAKMILLPEALSFIRDAASLEKQKNLTLEELKENNLAYRFFAKDNAISHLPALTPSSELVYSADKELETTNFLLNYFGQQRADRNLENDFSEQEYLDVQHGFLNRNPEINYGRGNIDILGISGLQRIIAARLGKGAALFNVIDKDKKNNSLDMGELPFYIIENRKLLPPMVRDSKASKIKQLALNKEHNLEVTFDSATTFAAGTFVDLTLTANKQQASQNIVRYRNLLIREVDAAKTTLTFYRTDDSRLSSNIERIIKGDAYADRTLALSTSMLQNFRTPITAKEIQFVTATNHYLIHNKAPLSAWFRVGNIVSFFEDKRDDTSPEPDHRQAAAFTAVINATDEIAQTFDFINEVKLVEGVRYYYEVTPDPSNTPFSSTLSIIFKQQWLDAYTSDENELAQWIEQVIKEEVPLHIEVHIYYFDDKRFGELQKAYQRWQFNNFNLGGDAYTILALLSLGQRPRDSFPGIGVMRIVDEATEKPLITTDIINKKDMDSVYALQDTDLFFVAPSTHSATFGTSEANT